MYADKIITPCYYDPIFTTDWKTTFKSDVNKFYSTVSDNGLTLIGILPYKLFQRDYHWVQPEKNFIKKHEPEMKIIMDLIKKIRNEPDDIKKLSTYMSYFNPYDD